MKIKIHYELVGSGGKDGVKYDDCLFDSYDKVKIPFYVMYPQNFKKEKTYPTVILFSGHGDMNQVAFDKHSYQKGLGLFLAKHGFLVYVMENRGMGKLSYLGDHNRIDAVARMLGGSWYGEISTDALWFVDFVSEQKSVNGKIGVGGVSTGGALSLIAAALNKKVTAAYVQGYLGSYVDTFGIAAVHDTCNNIANILRNFEMNNIAELIYPRFALYVNGQEDAFYAKDAMKAFILIKKKYIHGGYGDRVALSVPDNTHHEISVDLVLSFFDKTLK